MAGLTERRGGERERRKGPSLDPVSPDGLPWVLSGHSGLDLVAWLLWNRPSTARLAHMEAIRQGLLQ